MGGKTWSPEEEEMFWEHIVPQSPKAVDAANRNKSWEECAKVMQDLMGDDARRKYTKLMLFEHYFQNVSTGHKSPHARKYVLEHKDQIEKMEASRPLTHPAFPERPPGWIDPRILRFGTAFKGQREALAARGITEFSEATMLPLTDHEIRARGITLFGDPPEHEPRPQEASTSGTASDERPRPQESPEGGFASDDEPGQESLTAGSESDDELCPEEYNELGPTSNGQIHSQVSQLPGLSTSYPTRPQDTQFLGPAPSYEARPQGSQFLGPSSNYQPRPQSPSLPGPPPNLQHQTHAAPSIGLVPTYQPYPQGSVMPGRVQGQQVPQGYQAAAMGQSYHQPFSSNMFSISMYDSMPNGLNGGAHQATMMLHFEHALPSMGPSHGSPTRQQPE